VVTRLSIESRDLPVVCRASDAIVFFDVSTLRIVKANAAFGNLLGREPSDVLGRSFAELWEPASGPKGTARDVLLGDIASGGRTRMRHRNGSWVDVYVFAGEVEVDERPTVVTVVRDARASQDEDPKSGDSWICSEYVGTREADTTRTLALLAGSIAHDFNNLFSIIIGCVEALERTLPQGDRQREITGEIASASQRATSLIRKLVAFSRRVDPLVVDLNALLPRMERMLSYLLGSETPLVFQLDAGLPLVRVDVAQFEQVVMDLCTSARDAAGGGGEIVVATRAVTVDAANAGLEGRPPAGEWACLSVVGSGMGLGLTAAQAMVTQCGGHLSFETAPGEGTDARVWLPAIVAADEPMTRRGAAGG